MKQTNKQAHTHTNQQTTNENVEACRQTDEQQRTVQAAHEAASVVRMPSSHVYVEDILQKEEEEEKEGEAGNTDKI